MTKGTIRVGLAIERESIFARRVLGGMAAAAAEYAKSGVVFDLRFIHDRFISDSKQLKGYDGYIAQIQTDDMADRLARTKKPVVDVLFKKRYPHTSVVNVDNAKIAALAAKHLIERRFETLAFFGRNGVSYSDERYAAFAEEAAKAGKEVIHYEVPAGERARFFLGEESAKEEAVEDPVDGAYLKEWVRSLPKGTAVFCCQDLRAYQLMHAAYEAERAIPGDIAILGVDDDPIFCNFTDPRLTSVDPDAEAVGREALAAILSPGDRFVPPKGVTIRESTDLFRYDPPWLGDALGFIYREVSRNLTASDVFAFVGKSHTLVDRTFRRVLGTCVQKVIMKARLEAAAKLLKTTDRAINEVASMSGFASFAYFCSSFAAAYGMTAAEFRLRKE